MKAASIKDRFYEDLRQDYIEHRQNSVLFRYYLEHEEIKICDEIQKHYEEQSVTDYLVWLIDFLAGKPIYYSDNRLFIPANWKSLNHLINAGLGREDWTSMGKKISRISDDMAEALREIRESLKDPDVLKRLEQYGKNNEKEIAELTGHIKNMAVHIKIADFLTYAGYPLTVSGKSKKEDRSRQRKDKGLGLFMSFADSENGYNISRKTHIADGDPDSVHYDVSERFYYYVDKEDQDGNIRKLMEALNKGSRQKVFIPLAGDIVTGCLFFIAGKENYEEAYRSYQGKDRDQLVEKYKKCRKNVCFDFMESDGTSRHFPYSYRLQPRFHTNAGDVNDDYAVMLAEYKWYCTVSEKDQEDDREEEDTHRYDLKIYNGIRPAGVPRMFYDFFDNNEEDFEDLEEQDYVSAEARQEYIRAALRHRLL